MHEFHIQLRSVQDVLDFVALATSRAFHITVGDDRHQVNGKSFMEMFCLNFQAPLSVSVACTEPEFVRFLGDADRFLAK